MKSGPPEVYFHPPRSNIGHLSQIKDVLFHHLQGIWDYVGWDGSALNESVFQTFLGHESENALITKMEDGEFYKVVDAKMAQRTAIKMDTLAPYLTAKSYLDVGCGDGQLAEQIQIATRKSVVLTDVVPLNTTDLPFHLYDGNTLPFDDGSVEAALLYVVLHHTNNPDRVFSETSRVASSRVIVVEVVADSPQEALVSQFFDWFFNHIMIKAQAMPLTFQYRSSEHWIKEIRAQRMKLTQFTDLGWDHLPLLPEHRCLYVADK